MGTVNLIYDYFPELTEEQRERFARLEGLYREWNEKINVISRKDMDEFWVHHVCCIHWRSQRSSVLLPGLG